LADDSSCFRVVLSIVDASETAIVDGEVSRPHLSLHSYLLSAAVAFGYYETLMKFCNKSQIQAEENRMLAMRSMVKDLGFQEHLFEDFLEEAVDLIREASSAANPQAIVFQAFNDFAKSMSIITWFKVSCLCVLVF
jgi:hypothetical protein